MPACPASSTKDRLSHWPRCTPTAFWAGLALALASGTAVAAPSLSCEIFQSGDTLKLQFEPVSDPYVVKAVDINKRFRFKAVVMGSAEQIEYIKLYTYYMSSGRAVLLHYAKYLAPVPQKNAAPDSLTGVQYLYSPVLGREIRYSCALLEGSV